MKTTDKLPLLANSIFSGCSALLLFTFSSSIGAIMGISEVSILIWIGAGLSLFTGLLLYTFFQSPASTKLIKFIIIQDVLWVIGSIIILLVPLFSLTVIGYSIIGIIAAIVSVLAYFQRKLMLQ